MRHPLLSRILVPLDGSELSEAVLPYAKDVAQRLKAEIYFVRAVDIELPQMPVSEVAARASIEAMERQAEMETQAAGEYLEELARTWQREGIRARWDVVRGVPAAKIVELARLHDVDQIAMSTHGRSGLGRLLFGSVAGEVLRESGTPVLMVRPGQTAA